VDKGREDYRDRTARGTVGEKLLHRPPPESRDCADSHKSSQSSQQLTRLPRPESLEYKDQVDSGDIEPQVSEVSCGRRW
jgi:hypothetical protein